MIRSILVAVDGSEPAIWVVDRARELAVRCDARPTLLHVQADPSHTPVPHELEDYARIEHLELTEAAMRDEAAIGIPRQAEA